MTTGLDVGEWDYKLELPVHPNVGENNDTLICHREAFGGQCVRCDEMFEEYGKENVNLSKVDPLTSALACVVAIVSRKVVSIDLCEWEPESGVLTTSYVMDDL